MTEPLRHLFCAVLAAGIVTCSPWPLLSIAAAGIGLGYCESSVNWSLMAAAMGGAALGWCYNRRAAREPAGQDAAAAAAAPVGGVQSEDQGLGREEEPEPDEAHRDTEQVLADALSHFKSGTASPALEEAGMSMEDAAGAAATDDEEPASTEDHTATATPIAPAAAEAEATEEPPAVEESLDVASHMVPAAAEDAPAEDAPAAAEDALQIRARNLYGIPWQVRDERLPYAVSVVDELWLAG